MVKQKENTYVRFEGVWCVKSTTEYKPGARTIVAKRNGVADVIIVGLVHSDKKGNHLYEVEPFSRSRDY